MTELHTPQAGDDRARDTDVVALLMRQHGDIRNLFDEVEACEGEERRDAFRLLVRLLAVHETAEEEIVHPVARREISDGDGIVDDRLREERAAKELLQHLDGMDPLDHKFPDMLRELRDAVLEHARAEERYEFSYLQKATSVAQRRTMASMVKAAEAVAPTHPHAGVESATANILVGTPTAIMDRVRDAIRKAKPGN